MKYSEKQLEKIKEIMTRPELIKKREKITLYKSSDMGLALFRMQATRYLLDYTCRRVTGKPITKKLQAWFRPWLVDNNTMFVDYFNQLEIELKTDPATLTTPIDNPA